MRKTNLLPPLFFTVLLLLTLILGGCAVGLSYEASSPPEKWPGYVHLYPNGCWADGRWYAPCPWQPGPAYGYYYFHGGAWWHNPGLTWQYRPGHPPPPAWRHHDPRHRRYAPVPPRRRYPNPYRGNPYRPQRPGPHHGPHRR
jgi:hypothetical protein